MSGFLTPQAPARVSDAPPAVVAHDRLSRNLLWSYGAWAASAFAPLVTVPFCVRCLGNRLYGEWLIIMSLAAYLGLANLGLAQTVGNRIAVAIARKRRDEVGTLVATGFWTYALIAIALITMLLLGAHASGHRWLRAAAPQASEAFIIDVALICLAMPGKIYQVTRRGFERVDCEQILDARSGRSAA